MYHVSAVYNVLCRYLLRRLKAGRMKKEDAVAADSLGLRWMKIAGVITIYWWVWLLFKD